ncbi:MAG: DNA polymerase III subunit alpha [Candidatus Promineifilaceae bacterium]
MTEEHQPFVHLHVHSEFSLLDGLSRIKHLTARANELNMPALALTDHGTMYGTIDFYRACKKAEVKPILGVETYVASRRMQDKEPDLDRERFHLLLLAQNQTGYYNLLKLVSKAQLGGFYYRSRVDHELLEKHSDGLIATTGCLAGEIPRAIKLGNIDKAHQLMEWYVDVFSRDRFFVELQEHGIPELTEVNKTLLEMAGRYNLRMVATNDVHYTTVEEADPHDVLLCIQTGKTVDMQDRMRMSDQSYYLKSYDEMHKLFGEFPGALDNTLLIAEMCDVDPIPHGYHLPKFEVPEGYTPETYLRHLCEKGLTWRYGEARAESDQDLKERLNYELRVIHDMGFDAYFLIVWDLCEFARQKDIWWNVRGSGSGSVVAYTLGVTGIDPLVNGLIFERFLNPDRVSMPDIDLDYPDDRRHEMIEYTINKYGSDKVAQIITFGTMGARAAIRDVGRALDVPLAEVDGVAKLIPAISGKHVTIRDTLTPENEFYSADLLKLYGENAKVRNLVDTAENLEGVSRHASTHAAGVIISDRPLVDYTPLRRPTSGGGKDDGIGVVTQWPMEILDSIGLLKVDFLGLSTLTVLRAAADLISKRHQVQYTIDNIPYRVDQIGPDPDKRPEALFEMLGRGEVAGVFQVEGTGMRRLMTQMKPQRFEHIMAAISLFRPGPMDNIPDYVSRMHGRTPVTYHHPDLETILEETYGILVYQEQIIRIASEFAGYAPGEADMIRKAVAKKKRGLMDKHKAQFSEGAASKGYSQQTCEAIWSDIEFFARYGFNKAHAADYAVITCQTAFLKAHYPVEYMTALLSVERNDTDKVAQYLAESRRMGIAIAPPQINRSELDFSIEGGEEKSVIRYGLGAIKNAGAAAIEQILCERRNGGEFKEMADLCERVDLRRVGKRALESMVKVGVFDEWGKRPQVLESLDRAISHSGNIHDAAAAGQMSLFGGPAGLNDSVGVELLRPEVDLPEVDQHDVLTWEKELIGVYLSEHPLDRYLDLARELRSSTTAELDEATNDQGVAILGLLTSLRTFITKKGQEMAFGNLEDMHGSIELIFFPRTWKGTHSKVEVDRVYLVRGKVRIENGDRAKIIVDNLDNNLNLAKERVVQRDSSFAITGAKTETNLNKMPRRVESEPKSLDSLDSSPKAKVLNKSDKPVASEVLSSSKTPFVPPPPPNFDLVGSTPEVSDKSLVRPDDSAVVKSVRDAKLVVSADSSFKDEAFEEIRRSIVVEIEPSGTWRETCRRVVKIAGHYRGNDALHIRLSGQKMAMEFPNQNTDFCPELVEAFRLLPSVINVKAT